jgi:hypothetical protein
VKIRILNLMLLALLIITSPVQGLAIDVIPNLISYLNANSGKKTPYEKLELISELLNKKQLVGEAHDQAIHELMIKHVYEKKNNTPAKRLKAYEMASDLPGIWKGTYLRQILVNDVLTADDNYQKGDLAEKLKIIVDYDKKQGLGSRYFIPIMKQLLIDELFKRIKDKKIEDRGLITLKFYSELAGKGFKSTWFSYHEETEPLCLHLRWSKEFQKMDNADKISYLQSLHESKLIAIQTLCKFESLYYIDILVNNAKFAKMNDAMKQKFLEEQVDKGKMHFFTKGYVERALNIE